MSYLNDDYTIKSDFWFDQDNALDYIRTRISHVRPEMVDSLINFIERGYLVIPRSLSTDLIESFLGDIEFLWSCNSFPCVISQLGGERTIFKNITDVHRSPGYRLVDIHGYMESARQIVHNKIVYDYLEVLLETKVVGFQSLFFEWGSQQGLHRDPMFVRTLPPSALIASWTALEDIHSDSGPLVYIPRSHRFPYYEFVKGDTIMNKGDPNIANKRIEFSNHYKELMKEQGLFEESFTAKKGDTFIWHGSLLHGGAKQENFSLTRNSIVCHYCPVSVMRSVSNSIIYKESDKEIKVKQSTNNICSRNETLFFNAPIKKDSLSQILSNSKSTSILYNKSA